MKKRNQRLLSILLSVLMLISLLPTAAFAAVGSRALEDDAISIDAPSAGEDTSTDAARPAVVADNDLAADLLAAGDAIPDTQNLARLSGVTATASSQEANTVAPSNAIDGDTSSNNSRWGSAVGNGPHWLQIDLGATRHVNTVKIFWERRNILAYQLQGSTDGQSWTNLHECTSEITTVNETLNDFNTVDVRYLRIYISSHKSTGLKGDGTESVNWNTVSLFEVEVYGAGNTEAAIETPDGNLCRPSDGVTVTATASSNETTHVTPDKAIDGGFTNSDANSANVERWASNTTSGGQWLQIDLGTPRNVSVIKLFWQHDSVTAYNVQISADSTTWNTVYNHTSGRITDLDKVITFSPTVCQYIKINATAYDNQGSASWGNVSLWEVEAYRDENAVPQTPATLLSKLQAIEGGPLEINAAGTHVALKQAAQDMIPDDMTVTFAANLEQVVGADGTIYTPVVDKAVAFDLTVTDSEGTSASTPGNSPIQLTIPGEHTVNEGNAKPAVIPELMEWYSSAAQNGQKFTLTANSRIIHRYGVEGGFNDVANELTADVEDLFGLTLEHVHNLTTYEAIENGLRAGDIVIYNVLPNGTADNRGKVKGFDEESYRIEISDHVTIFATDETGAYWGTRTLLQALKLSQANDDGLTVPCGTARDYPEFKLRGFVLDVGRKPQSMDMLYNIVKNMSWYKLNDFHVHLNDNLIQIEEYGYTSNDCTQEQYDEGNRAYAAFRLESSLQEEEGATPLAAKDYHYTKAEFKQFITDSAAMGVTIVPEIDVPAHAKAITDAWPSLREPANFNIHALNDHFDLSNKFDASLAKTKEIFNDYIDDGTFCSGVVHFGADEYYPNSTLYRKFHKAMIAYLREKNVTIRTWGSLTRMDSSDPDAQYTREEAAGVQMNIWNTSWANPQAMYNLGFDLINVTDGPFYMVPNGGGGRGGYGDYLNLSAIYEKAPNNIGGTWFPASSSQILGSAYAIWGDSMLESHSTGMNEVDVFDRFFDTLPVIAVRQWGVENNTPARTLTELQADAAIIGTAPCSNPYYKTDETDFFAYDFSDNTDKSGNGHDLTLTNAQITSSKSLLVLNGGESYAETGLDRLGWGNQLSFRAFKLASGEEEIIFEGDHAYGDFSIKALPVEGKENVWKLGFSRELHDYEFDVELPVGEWVKLTLTTAQQSTKLSVNGGEPVAAVGQLVAKPDSNTQFKGKTGITNSSLELPVARIGSKTNAFRGYIAAVSTGEPIDVPFITASAPSFNSDGLPFYAIDGNTSTIYHSNWNSPVETNGPLSADLTAENRYIQLDLTTPVTLSGLKYLRRNNGGNGTVTAYEIKVSTDGETYTSVKTGSGWGTANDWDTATFSPQSDVISVRLYGTTTTSGFMSAAEIELVYEPIVLTDDNAAVTVGDVAWGETEATAEIAVALKPSGFILTEGIDYTVTYSNNTAAGEATATITGTGGYTGTLTATFTVPTKPAIVDISSASVTFAASYPLENGKAEPNPTVKLGNTTLLLGLDYTVTYTGNTRPGTATATITGIGDYEGSVTATFTVTGTIVKQDISKATITLPQANYPHTGSPITPEPLVVMDGEELVKDTDYTVSYRSNTNIGTATVTVTGKAPYYEGTATVQFNIIDPATAKDLSDRAKTAVTFAQTAYDLVNGKAEPEPIVRYEGKRLTKDTDYTVSYLNNTTGGTGVAVIQGINDYIGRYAATFTINGGGSTGGSTGGSSSGGSSSGGSGFTSTTTSKQPDGATVTKKTDAAGVITTEASYPDGTKVSGVIGVDGLVTAVVTLPKRAEEVTVTVPTRTAPTAGQVAVILHPDGTEEIVKTSLPVEDGIRLTLDADAIVQVTDNAKTFVDVPADSWANEAITFVTAREIFNGTGSRTFSPNDEMSRAMVCTVLANLAGEDTKGGATWYDKAVAWAVANDVSDGTVPNAIITREQLAAMLYRYAGSPTVTDEVPRRFLDHAQVSDWAELAVTWAVENDLLRGRDGLYLAPTDTATRAEVAAVLQRYVALMSK